MRREILPVILFTALAQGLGFFKLWVVARMFGVSAEYDGYNLALVVPTWLSGILAALIQTGLFPVRARLAAERGEAAAQEFERAVLTLVVVGGAVLTLLLWSSRHVWLGMIASDVPPQTMTAIEIVLPFAVSLVLLNAAADTWGYLLAIRGRYWIAAAAPAANALLATGLLLAWPEGGLFNLALGTVLGLAIQLIIVGWAVGHYGVAWPAPWRGVVSHRAALKEAAHLSAWILPGVVFSNALATLPPTLLAAHGEGAVSAFSYAYRLHSSAVQLLIMVISPLILAHFSIQIAKGNMGLIRRILQRATLAALMIGIVALVMVATVGGELLLWLLGTQSDRLTIERVSLQWTCLTASLSFTLLTAVYAKLWQAQGRTRFISLMAGMTLLIFLLSAKSLIPITGEYAVSLGIMCSYLFASAWGFLSLIHIYRSASS